MVDFGLCNMLEAIAIYLQEQNPKFDIRFARELEIHNPKFVECIRLNHPLIAWMCMFDVSRINTLVIGSTLYIDKSSNFNTHSIDISEPGSLSELNQYIRTLHAQVEDVE